MRTFFVLTIVFSLTACGDFDDETLQKSLLKRASFDFNCPTEELRLTELSRSHGGNINSLGVTGCGRKGVYTRPLENTYWSRER